MEEFVESGAFYVHKMSRSKNHVKRLHSEPLSTMNALLITCPSRPGIESQLSDPRCIGHGSEEKATHIGGSKLHETKLQATSRRKLLLATMDTIVPSLMVAQAAEAHGETSIRKNGAVMLQGLPYTASLSRRGEEGGKDAEEVEILAVKLKVLRAKASAFHVFIDLPNADEQTPITSVHCAGSYFHEPRRIRSSNTEELQETVFRIGIGDVIQELGLRHCPTVSVTIVPCGADKQFPVFIESLYIEYE